MSMVVSESFGQPEVHKASGKQMQDWQYQVYNLAHQYNPEVLSFHLKFLRPDVAALEKAYQILGQRHESLRTNFCMECGQLKQVIRPYNPDRFTLICQEVSPETSNSQAIQIAYQQAFKVIPHLDTNPLVQSYLFLMGDHALFCLVIHHIIADVWSIGLLKKELRILYEAFCKGQENPLSTLPYQLKDYTGWQHLMLSGKKGDKHYQYWRKQLQSLSPLHFGPFYQTFTEETGIESPFQQSGPNSLTEAIHLLDQTKAHSYVTVADEKLHEALRHWSQTIGVSMFGITMASLSMLFYKLNKQEDVLLLASVADRFRKETQSLVGHAMGNIYLRNQLNPHISLKQYVAMVYKNLIAALRNLIYNHQPLDDLLPRGACVVLVNFKNDFITGQVKQSVVPQHTGTTASFFALECSITECANGLVFEWTCNDAFFSPTMIEYIARKHIGLLQEMILNRGKEVHEIGLCETEWAISG